MSTVTMVAEGVHLVITVLALVLFFLERHRRTRNDQLMLGFLHGIMPAVEAGIARPTSTPSDWKPLLPQVNDMLTRLQPKK